MKHDLNNRTKRETNKRAAGNPVEPVEFEDNIRRRAYELYEQRGRQDGQDLQDWFQAEHEILSSGESKAA